MAWWSLGYAIELATPGLAGKVFWCKAEYPGIATIPVWWLMLALTYTGQVRWLKPGYVALLLIMPVITILMAWTSEFHNFYWVNIRLEVSDGYAWMAFERGPWYWVNVAYSYILLLGGMILLVYKLIRSPGLYQQQIVTMLVASLVPWLGNLVYMLGLAPVGLDTTPFFFTLAGVILAWGLVRFRLLDIVPIAHDAVFQHMGDAVIVLDTRKRIVDLNPAAQVLIGKGISEVIGQDAAQVMAGWPALLERLEMLESIAEKGAGRAEVKMTVGGEVSYFDLRLSPLRGPRRRLVGQLIVLRDVTERVQYEEVLQAGHDRLAALLRIDAELNRKLALSHVLTFALDAALRLSGASAGFIGLATEGRIRVAEMVGRYPAHLAHSLLEMDSGIIGRAVRRQHAERVIDVKSDRDYVALIPETQAQIVIPLLAHRELVGVLNLETEEPKRFSAGAFEVVNLLAMRVAVAIENARMYEERVQLVEDLDAFAHTVAHDLGNPLAQIITAADLIKALYPQFYSDKCRMYLDTIAQGGRKMGVIIDNLLLLAGVRGMEEVAVSELDMGSIVAEVQKRLAFMIEEGRAELVLPDSWLPALGYAPWVEEVWANYISNAVKYGGQPPYVELGSTATEDGMVRFWVHDNGLGIPLEEQEALFQPFKRLDQVKVKGHGLGLSIVQRIVTKLGGKVGVESVPGQGSTFWFELPAARPLAG